MPKVEAKHETPSPLTRRQVLTMAANPVVEKGIAVANNVATVATAFETSTNKTPEVKPEGEEKKVYSMTVSAADLQFSERKPPSGLFGRLLPLVALAAIGAGAFGVLSGKDRFFAPTPRFLGLPPIPVHPGATLEDLREILPGVAPKTIQDLLMTMQALDRAQSRLPGTAARQPDRTEIILQGPRTNDVTELSAVMMAMRLGSSLGSDRIRQQIADFSENGRAVPATKDRPSYVIPDVEARLHVALSGLKPVPGTADTLYKVDYKGGKRLVSPAASAAVMESLPEAIDRFSAGLVSLGIPVPSEVIPVGSGATGLVEVKVDDLNRVVSLESDFFEALHVYNGKVKTQEEFVAAYTGIKAAMENGRLNPTLADIKSIVRYNLGEALGRDIAISLPEKVGDMAIMRTIESDSGAIVQLVRWLALYY